MFLYYANKESDDIMDSPTKQLRWFPHNIRAIMAKIKLPEKPGGMWLFWIQLLSTYRDLSSQADPARENWTWSCPYFT